MLISLAFQQRKAQTIFKKIKNVTKIYDNLLVKTLQSSQFEPPLLFFKGEDWPYEKSQERGEGKIVEV